MQIYYPKRRLLIYFAIGVITTTFSLLRIFGEERQDIWSLTLLLLGVMYIGGCIYYYKKNYIQVTSHKIKVNAVLPYEIVINNITEADYNAGTYTFRTQTKKVSFDRSQIDEQNHKIVDDFYQSVKRRLPKN